MLAYCERFACMGLWFPLTNAKQLRALQVQLCIEGGKGKPFLGKNAAPAVTGEPTCSVPIST